MHKTYIPHNLYKLKMKLILKSYKLSKLKNYFKDNSVILIYNIKTKKEFIDNMQHFKKSNFSSYSVSNSLIKKCLKNSIYLNYISLISSLIILIRIKNNSNLTKFNKQNLLLGIKINNKIYSVNNNIFDKKNLAFNYKQEVTNLVKIFKQSTQFVKKISK